MKIMEFLTPGIKINKDLNPSLWQENQLYPEVKKQLLKIALHFKKFVKVDFPIIDIVITGGQVGNFYTEKSDLDLHLITDFQKINCDDELEELFDTKKNLYKKEYDITVKGIPVELYVEDIHRPGHGGTYSIIKDKWLRPVISPTQNIDFKQIEKQSQILFDIISRHLTSNNLELLKKLKKKLWLFRQQGLAKQGEFGTSNLVFKTLRNSGIIDDLRNKIKDLETAELKTEKAH